MIRLFSHQRGQLAFFRKRARALSLLPYGAGKTLPAVLRIRDLCPPNRALVVTTASLVPKWVRDLERFGDKNWKVAALEGSAKRRVAIFRERQHVGVTNYEGVGVLEPYFHNWYDVVVFDEVHRLRNPESGVSRRWARLVRDIDYVYGLTGSPLLENPLDVFGVVRAVNHKTFGEDPKAFFAAFFDPVEGSKRAGGQRFRLKPGALVEIAGALHAMSYHRDRGQLDQRLPTQAHAAPLAFDMHPSVRRFYERLEKGARRIVRLRGVAPQQAATRLEKMAQVTRGWLYGENQALRRLGPNRARTKLLQHLEAIRGSGPVVIWAARRPDLDDVAAALGALDLSCVVVDGQMPVRRRDLAMRSFNGGNLDALVAHPRCLGEGVDLQAPYSLRYSYRWSAQEYHQALGRLMRPTNAYPHVTHTTIVARRSIDEAILLALRRKESLLELVLGARDIPSLRTPIERVHNV